MRYLLLLLVFPFTSFVGAEKGEFTVRIIQDGYEVKPVNGEVWLAKKPFRIDVSLERLDGSYGWCQSKGRRDIREKSS